CTKNYCAIENIFIADNMLSQTADTGINHGQYKPVSDVGSCNGGTGFLSATGTPGIKSFTRFSSGFAFAHFFSDPLGNIGNGVGKLFPQGVSNGYTDIQANLIR